MMVPINVSRIFVTIVSITTFELISHFFCFSSKCMQGFISSCVNKSDSPF